jgi:hypothetical protein
MTTPMDDLRAVVETEHFDLIASELERLAPLFYGIMPAFAHVSALSKIMPRLRDAIAVPPTPEPPPPEEPEE